METKKKLTQKQFEKFTKLAESKLGVILNEAKREMVQGKVDKLMRELGLDDYDAYYDLVLTSKGEYWQSFVDEITIHKTNFFREDNHFIFIRNKLDSIIKNNPRIMRNMEIKVWSSACSTGDEAYTLGMVLKEHLPPEINVRILADRKSVV